MIAIRDSVLAIAQADDADATPQVTTGGIADGAVTTVKMDAERMRVLKYSHNSSAAGIPSWKEVTIDSTIDWRGRMILVNGSVYRVASLAASAAYIVGGANDNELTYDRLNALTAGGMFLSRWMYTEDGGATYSTLPYIDDAATKAYIWVSAAGALKLTWRCDDANTDYAAINLIILYTETI